MTTAHDYLSPDDYAPRGYRLVPLEDTEAGKKKEGGDNALMRGWETVKRGASVGKSLAVGDYDAAAQGVSDMADYSARNPQSAEQKEIMEAWQRGKGVFGSEGSFAEVGREFAKDWNEAGSAFGKLRSAARNVKGIGESIVEQTPNMVFPMLGMGAGAAAGGAAGSAVPIIGNTAGAALGGWAGASLGNAAVEAGGMVQEALHEAGINPRDKAAVSAYLKEHGDEILTKAGIKGAVIGAVDTATMGAASKLLGAPGRKAMSRALGDMGIDMADKAAVKTAMSTPEFAQRIAADAAYQASKKGVGNAARNVTAAAMEPGGEYAGEFLGTLAAGGDWSPEAIREANKEAWLEAVMSMGQSGITFAGQKGWQAIRAPRGLPGVQSDADTLMPAPDAPQQPPMLPAPAVQGDAGVVDVEAREIPAPQGVPMLPAPTDSQVQEAGNAASGQGVGARGETGAAGVAGAQSQGTGTNQGDSQGNQAHATAGAALSDALDVGAAVDTPLARAAFGDTLRQPQFVAGADGAVEANLAPLSYEQLVEQRVAAQNKDVRAALDAELEQRRARFEQAGTGELVQLRGSLPEGSATGIAVQRALERRAAAPLPDIVQQAVDAAAQTRTGTDLTLATDRELRAAIDIADAAQALHGEDGALSALREVAERQLDQRSGMADYFGGLDVLSDAALQDVADYAWQPVLRQQAAGQLAVRRGEPMPQRIPPRRTDSMPHAFLAEQQQRQQRSDAANRLRDSLQSSANQGGMMSTSALAAPDAIPALNEPRGVPAGMLQQAAPRPHDTGANVAPTPATNAGIESNTAAQQDRPATLPAFPAPQRTPDAFPAAGQGAATLPALSTTAAPNQGALSDRTAGDRAAASSGEPIAQGAAMGDRAGDRAPLTRQQEAEGARAFSAAQETPTGVRKLQGELMRVGFAPERATQLAMTPWAQIPAAERPAVYQALANGGLVRAQRGFTDGEYARVWRSAPESLRVQVLAQAGFADAVALARRAWAALPPKAKAAAKAAIDADYARVTRTNDTRQERSNAGTGTQAADEAGMGAVQEAGARGVSAPAARPAAEGMGVAGRAAVGGSDGKTVHRGAVAADSVRGGGEKHEGGAGAAAVEPAKRSNTSKETVSTPATKAGDDGNTAAQQESEPAPQGVGAVRQLILGQLETIGRFDAPVNEVYAGIVAAYYGARARQLGMDAQQFYESYPLSVDADGAMDAGALAQQAPKNKEATVKTVASATGAYRTNPVGRFPSNKAMVVTRQTLVNKRGPHFYKRSAFGVQGFFDPKARRIALLDGADASTWAHEAEHFFFANDVALAESILEAHPAGEGISAGERALLDDVATLLAWHGIRGDIATQLAAWRGMDTEAQRPIHERQAKAFERYLLEGEAPSAGVRGYFERMKQWLQDVYKSIKGFVLQHPEVGSIPKEVRAVFDRTLGAHFTPEQLQEKVQAGELAADEVFTSDGRRIRLQNRDRGGSGSQQQVNKIAAKPRFLAVAGSNDMMSGAPVVFGNADELPAGAVVGRTKRIEDGYGSRYRVRYAVVEAGDIITSHGADGASNASYATGEAGKLRAVAGNGRAAGLIEGWQRGTMDGYRAELLEEAAQEFGIDAAALEGMKQPVLVRVMREGDIASDMGDRTNTAVTAQLTPQEQAANDAKRIDLTNVDIDERGQPTRKALDAFIQATPEAERAGMLDAKTGEPTKQAADRFMAAIFKQAYQNDELVRLYAQATDPDARNVLHALAQAAPVIARLSDKGQYDLRDAYAGMAQDVVNAARRGEKLQTWITQGDFERSGEASILLDAIADDIRAPRRMGETLTTLAKWAQEQADLEANNAVQGGFAGFGDNTKPREQLFKELAERTAAVRGQGAAGGGALFSRSRKQTVPEKMRAARTLRDLTVADGATREQALDELKKLAHKPLVNDEMGWTAYINSEQRKKIVSAVARAKSVGNLSVPSREAEARHYALAARMEQLWKHAVYVGEFEDANHEPGMHIYRFAVAVRQGGEVRYATILAKHDEVQMKDGSRRAYSLELHEEETLQSMLGSLVDERIDPPDTAAPIRSVREIVRAIEAKVKPQQNAPVFSRAKQGEQERNLVITHNLTAENLLHAVKMGGLPVPSLAVTTKDNPLQGFGEITLIGDEALADPRGTAGTRVYGADIYSPRYPRVSHQINDKALKSLRERVADMRKVLGSGHDRLVTGFDFKGDPRGHVEKDIAVMGQFLRDNHVEPEIIRYESGQVDSYKTERAMRQQMEKAALSDKYQEHVDALVGELVEGERIFQGYTNSGRRRYIPHTLENVVKILKKELRGGEGFNYGTGNLRAKFTPQFRTIEQIRKAKGRLVSKEDFAKIKDEINDELFEVARAISSKIETNTAIWILEDTPKMGAKRAAAQAGYNISDETAARIYEFLEKLKNLPTEYFEAKILRAVQLSEFSGAVVPEGTDKKVLDALKAAGITDIRTYKEGEEGARARAIAGFERLMFRRNTATQNTASPASEAGIESDTAAKPLTAKQRSIVNRVKLMAASIQKVWQNAPRIEVVWNAQSDGVPDDVRAQDALMRSNGAEGTPEAVYVPEQLREDGTIEPPKVIVFASQVGTVRDMVRVVAHEVLGHHGLRGAFGRGMARVLNELMIARRAEVVQQAREYGLLDTDKLPAGVDADSATDAQVWAAMSEHDRQQAAEEVLAHLAETYPQLPLVRRAIAAIRTWLRQHVPGFDRMGVSDDEIVRSFILPAREWVERGRSGRSFSEWAMFSRASRDAKTGEPQKPKRPTLKALYEEFKQRTQEIYERGFDKEDTFAAKVVGTDGKLRRASLSLDVVTGMAVDKNGTLFISDKGGEWRYATAAMLRQRAKEWAKETQGLRHGRELAQWQRDHDIWEAAELGKRLGLEARSVTPSDSTSRYVYLTRDDGEVLKVRAANHAQPRERGRVVGGFDSKLGKRHDPSHISIDPVSGATLADALKLVRQFAKGERVALQDDGHTAPVHQLLQELLDAARDDGNENREVSLGEAAPSLVNLMRERGFPIYGDERHTADIYAVRFVLKNRAHESREGRLPITDADVRASGEVIRAPDAVVFRTKGKGKTKTLAYIKQMPDGAILYVEEVRTGSGALALKDMKKFSPKKEQEEGKEKKAQKKGKGANNNPGALDVKAIASGLLPTDAQSDPGDVEIVPLTDAFRQLLAGEESGTSSRTPPSSGGGGGSSNAPQARALFSRTKKPQTPEQRADALRYGGVGSASAQRLSFMEEALQRAGQVFTHPGRVSLWDKTIGTMRHLAERVPAFKAVYEAATRSVEDVSTLANWAMDAAPRWIPKLDGWQNLAPWRKEFARAVSAKDSKAVAKPLFEGTLSWARDVDGSLALLDDLQQKYDGMSTREKGRLMVLHGKLSPNTLKAWEGMTQAAHDKAVNGRFEREVLRAGVVFTDAELRAQFGLNDQQISLYREARAGINRSLDLTARADMLRLVAHEMRSDPDAKEQLRRAVLDADSLDAARGLIKAALDARAAAAPKRAEELRALAADVGERVHHVYDLMGHGYAPLSRFGRFTVDVVDKATGERLYFGMYESKRESNLARIKLAQAFPEAEITQGTLSEREFELFQGVTPETLEHFGEALQSAGAGDAAQDAVFQEYLRRTKNNHSALKRMIHRKGIAGYSEDVGRVLASFIYSNARAGSMALNAGDMERAITAIPKEQGELKDVAVGLRDYLKNPREGGQIVRSFLFAQYLGGSIASAMVNATQPWQVTMPWLSQYGGMARAARQVTRAYTSMTRRNYEPALARALKAAEEDGTVSPQEVHQLMAQARGVGSLSSGDGTKKGAALALVGNTWQRLKLGWGVPFALAEQMNRRAAFIAAWRTASEQLKMGEAEAAEFARRAVEETQFVYCVDGETECLTTKGWKKRDELSVGDTVIGVDMLDGGAVETPLLAVHKFPGRHKVTAYSNANRFSMVVTDGHRNIVQNYSSKNKRWLPPVFRETVALRDGHHLMRVPQVPIARALIGDEDFAALLGWIAAEGNYAKFRCCKERRNVRLTQSRAHNPQYVAEIEALLQRLGGHYRKFHTRGDMVTFTLRKPLSERVLQAMPEKLLTWKMAQTMSVDEMRALMDAFAKGDGTKAANNAWLIGQKKVQNLHVLQAMAVMCGRNATMYPPGKGDGDIHHLYLHGQGLRTMVKQLDREETEVTDGVWCPETGAGTWIARRNGAVFVTGNSKANKPTWARGTIGGSLMTFKTYSVSYLELMHRMWTQGGKEGKRAVAWSVAMLLLVGGAGGLPFMEDAEDLIDGAGQLMGYNISSKHWRDEFLRKTLGEEIGSFMESGMSALPGMPVDVSGRLGMGNLIPGTGLMLTKQDRSQDLKDIAGAAGDFVSRAVTGIKTGAGGLVSLVTGDVGAARDAAMGVAREFAPKALTNADKGVDMARHGMYRDSKGAKVIDTKASEALAKLIGFQPVSVARVQEANSFMQRSKSFYQQKAADIRLEWAQALFEKDDAKLQRVRQKLADWNRKNPEQKITVDMRAVWRRVREMKKDRSQRIADTAPKALRRQMRERLAEEQAQREAA